MKTFQRRIMIIGLWLISVTVSFCAGAFLIYEYYIFGDPITSSTACILVDPPVDGPLYDVDDFIRANNDVKAYLSQQQQKSEFDNMHPRFIVVPEHSGYTIYASSGLRGTAFPKDLYESTKELMKKSLGEINIVPISTEPQAEQAAPSNR